MLYIYALLASEPPLNAPAGTPALGRGLAEELLQVIPCDGILAVAGEVSASPPVAEDTCRAHDRVVRSLAALSPAILPARFGSAVDNAAALRALLQHRRQELSQALELVRGREQMTLRIYAAAAAPPPRASSLQDAAAELAARSGPPSGPPSDDDPAGGPGTRYLAARARELEDAAASVPGLEALRPQLARWIRAERVRLHPRTPPLIATVYHLIDRGAGGDYVAAVEAYNLAHPVADNPGAYKDASPLRLAPSGPWPPYAFAEQDWPLS